MAFPLFCSRSGQMMLRNEPCIFCLSRQFRRFIHHEAGRTSFFSQDRARYPPKVVQSGRSYSSKVIQKTPQQVRTELDDRNSSGFYALARSEGLIAMDPSVAKQIIIDFRDSNINVTQLTQKYGLQLSDLTNLATATYRIPDVEDKTGRLPPSQHKNIAKRLLLACSKANDSAATLHILRAVYLTPSLPRAGEIASLFSAAEIRVCRQALEVLATTDDADAKTLLGEFYETEGYPQRARTLYEQALALKDATFDPDLRGMALPQVPAWNTLGCLLLAQEDSKSQEQAKAAFRKGAIEGDDPLSYYYLASYEDRFSGPWLHFMTKAASSGHLEAMYNLGNFYMEANSYNAKNVKSQFLTDNFLVTSLRWLTQWKEDSARKYAIEWFSTAAEAGHKPSMLELADIHELQEDIESAITWLERVTEPTAGGRAEQWPRLVDEAKRRLQTLIG